MIMTKISAAVQQRTTAPATATASVGVMLNSLLDREGYRKRFDELLGKRAPQFVSSIVSMVNGDKNLQKAFMNAPITVIQSALKAATFDLPIDPTLGYAYIVPFNNRKDDGSYVMEASFVIGYRGLLQLAMRTGAYEKINVVDVREGELVSYNRLTEDVELEFVEDEDERDALPIVGWCGYYRLTNGMEKTIYMSRKQIVKHEEKNRKGKYMGKGWRTDFDAMAAKTVLRRLIGKWGILSIDYQMKADASTMAAAEALATGKVDDMEAPMDITPEFVVSDEDAAIVAELDREQAEAQEAEQQKMEM
jgi:recombination protein RecT